MMDREYHREYSRRYYHKKREEYKQFLGGKCKKCNSKIGLQFDHIDPKNKSFPIGKLLNFSMKKAMNELLKCQLLCEKCHLIKTHSIDENTRRYARGSVNKNSTLTESDVLEIRDKLKEANQTWAEIAEEYGVTKSNLWYIYSRKTWKHI